MDEILAVLDDKGALDGLPFMPEMAAFCGHRFRVSRRANRTCVEDSGEGLLSNTVFLEDVRCDGSHHDGCQRRCLMFWHERWLRQPTDARIEQPTSPAALSRLPVKIGERYYCQSTELKRITTPSRGMVAGVALLTKDLLSGEISLSRYVMILGNALINKFRKLIGLAEIGRLSGPGTETSKGNLDLEPGELVEIRPLAEISRTLDRKGKNRGLNFDPEMALYSGPYEVERRIERIILETTGEMRTLTHTVALKGVDCQGLCARNCPRANPIYWREIWLRRLEPPSEASR
ncbi:hypothetical protein [Rhodopseudomonas sp. B29]|uniref:hypothetical protein n=1 Tax=Rhodopseudomonas sp. B29 TaxID=95607 RepID=UPI0011D1A704|nr:hypothetical protein [Rhodopseudomonas sp. B29]